MRIVLVARGAEDARSPTWGHLVLCLRELGHEVISFDPVLHVRVGKADTIAYVRQWFVSNWKPDVVCIVSTNSEHDAELKRLALERNVRVVTLPAVGIEPGEEVSAAVARVDSDLFAPRQSDAQHDVVVVADASVERAEQISALAESFDIVVHGSGWSRFPSLEALAFGPVPYAEVPALLSTARVTAAFKRQPGENYWVPVAGAVSAFEAMSLGVPCVVPVSLGTYDLFAGMPSYADTPSLVDAVGEALKNVDELTFVVAKQRDAIVNRHGVRTQLVDLFGEDTSVPIVSVKRDGPRVSVLTAAYNIPEFIGQSIESMLNQTAGDLEVLVLDDGSSDATRSVIDKYTGDRRVRVFDQENIGQTGRFDMIWRTLLPHAKGDFIASLDGDDVSMPDHLERTLAVFDEDPGVGLVHTAATCIDENDAVVGPCFPLVLSYDDTSQLRNTMSFCYIAHPTILMRHEMYDRVGDFEEGYSPDYHFWIKSAKYFRFRYLPEKLIKYRVHSKASDRTAWKVEGARTRNVESQRWTIRDLYPTLTESTSARDYAAAHIDLGVRFFTGLVDRDLALDEFGRAQELLNGTCLEAEWNIALVLWHTGQKDEARRRFASLAERDSRFPDIYTANGFSAFAPGHDISADPFEVPTDRIATAKWWDGTSVTLQRILLAPDLGKPHTLAVAVEAFAARTSVYDSVDLCVATLGAEEGLVAETLMRNMGKDVDLDTSAPIVIERVDDWDFVPAARYLAKVDLREIFSAKDAVAAIADALQQKK